MQAYASTAAVILTILGVAIYVGRLLGALPYRIAEAVRVHERECANFEPVSKVRPHPLASEASDR
jgi:hypothetical protein